MLRKTLIAACLLLSALIFSSPTPAMPQPAADATQRPFLHPLFTDNMVLQRDIAAPVWGWTTPGQRVTVTMSGRSATAVADAGGKWMARIGPFPAGGPHTLTVTGPQTVRLNNVMTGDVWICSGQSNMEQGIGIAANPQQEISNANYPNLRLFTVPKKIAASPQSSVAGSWQITTPQTIAANGWGGFSAVAYYFGRELNTRLQVPIGLLHTSWGGTVAEAWASAEALNTMPDFRSGVAALQRAAQEQSRPGFNFDGAMTAWWAANDPGSAAGWSNATLDTAAWKTMNLPTAWENADLPNFDGIVWFRKEFDLPQSWAGKDVVLHLGTIDDRDTTWVNGTKVGETNEYNTARNYRVAGNLLKAGRNVITVRVLDTGGGGGLNGNAADMNLQASGDGAAAPISLAGAWLYHASTPLAQTQPAPQRIDNNPNGVTVLYNGMIAPLVPFGIKGAIWYQGESNAGRGQQYRTLLPTMIRDWRSRFGVGDFPFYIVQLANFMATEAQPSDPAWAYLREAQMLTAQTVPNAGIATAIDIGEAGDIHPKNKQDVGRRLALNALALTYKQPVEYSGPLYRSMKIEGDAVRLTFSHAASMTAGGGTLQGFAIPTLQGFAIAGADKKFVWANARIEGNTVVVSSPQVKQPVAVRYAWANNPVANLYNAAGLPALPFRTDID
ncbi:MAG TPA: sialate O-acetylesterase [Abditibacteriaceae bacterium]|jgi:sialate O-acetylesterase